jgi:hypothetical protein
MANRQFYQFLYSLNPMLTVIEGNIVVGSSGAVGTTKGSGIASVTKLGAAGTYKIVLDDAYNRYLFGTAAFVSPAIGSNINDGSLVSGTLYRITAVGTSDFTAIGAARNAVGVSFVATGVGGAGSGTVKAVGNSGIVSVEVGDTDVQSAVQLKEGVIIQCLGATSSSDTTLIPKNPTAGCVLGFTLFLRNSSIAGKGE